jgi:hypothetical protein
MDSNTPADPWDIPAVPTEPPGGVVAVADDTDAEPPEASQPEPSTEPVSDEVTPDADPVDETAVEGQADVSDVADDAEPIEVPEESAQAASEHRFDLGLDGDEPWEEPSGSFEAGTAFDLIPPSAEDAEDEPDFEVTEPDLSETFVTSAGDGRPDHSLPQLRDPAPMFAVAEEDDLPEPDLPADEPTPESKGFRLPGLSFARRATDPEPAEIEVDDVPTVAEDVAEDDEPVAAVTGEETAAAAPSLPSAWAEAPDPGSSDPGSPFASPEAATEHTDPETGTDTEPPAEPDPEPVVEVAADEDTDVDEPLDEDPESTEPEPAAAEEAEMTATDGETDFELTDPDISDLVDDVAELYVTETVPKEERPPALLTVDTVPGATIAQAVDVVNAVASASDEADLAAALDRTMDQLRAKAVEFGGDAVISVRTEVQEMGGGFLVTASGTVVTLA